MLLPSHLAFLNNLHLQLSNEQNCVDVENLICMFVHQTQNFQGNFTRLTIKPAGV